MVLPDERLRQFLIKAKTRTYAGNGELSESSRPESKDLHYREGELLYIDSYLGSFNFIGEEAVFEYEKPVWGMNYFGRMLVHEIPEGFINCLKSALLAVPVEYPFRGPSVFECEDFTYKCFWQGELAGFTGYEEIYRQGTCLYKLDFHGGFIK